MKKEELIEIGQKVRYKYNGKLYTVSEIDINDSEEFIKITDQEGYSIKVPRTDLSPVNIEKENLSDYLDINQFLWAIKRFTKTYFNSTADEITSIEWKKEESLTVKTKSIDVNIKLNQNG